MYTDVKTRTYIYIIDLASQNGLSFSFEPYNLIIQKYWTLETKIFIKVYWLHMSVSKIKGTPKMDGENNGKPYWKLDDLGENPLFLETSRWRTTNPSKRF